jgi:hypothetical protein
VINFRQAVLRNAEGMKSRTENSFRLRQKVPMIFARKPHENRTLNKQDDPPDAQRHRLHGRTGLVFRHT